MEQQQPTNQITIATKPVLMSLVTQPEQYYQTLQISNLKEAIQSKSICIGALPKVINNGNVFVKSLMIQIITDVCLFLNVGKNMNANQISMTADMIIKDYNFLKVEDFKLCFNNAKKGVYGKQYDRLDGQVIFEWLDVYVNDRADESERLSIEKHKEDLRIKNEGVNIEGQKKVIQIIGEVLNNVEVKLEEKKPKKVVERDPRLTEYFNDYEKLANKNKDPKNRFVEFNGKMLSQMEYIEERLKNGA